MRNLETIADNLKVENRFIHFDKDKQPISYITLKPISIKKEGNFMNYKKALEGLKNSSKIKGIGFVLGNTPKGNFCGLDIDNCIDSNGVLSEEAQKIIDILDTYAEISPSGKGVHCIFFARKQGNICKKYFKYWCKCMEIYDKDRYFTLTGIAINDKNVEYRQKECDFIYEKYFSNSFDSKKGLLKNTYTHASSKEPLNLVFALENDRVLNSYWHGNRPLKSESENDFALLGKILFWVGYENPDVAIQHFLESPYFKQKDEKHLKKVLDTNYLIRTVEKIINLNVEVVHE